MNQDFLKTVSETLFNRIPAKDRVFFMRQLAIMITSGIALSNSLSLLAQQSSNPTLKRALRIMTQDVENGHPFSVAAGRFPMIFDPVSLAMIKTGEASGQMQVIVNGMADNAEKSQSFSGKIRGALIYPIFIIIVMFIVGIVMTTVVIPKLTSVFEETSLTLPWTTQVLIGVSNFMIHYWWLVVILVVAASAAIKVFTGTPQGREYLYSFQMRIPAVRNLISNSYLSRFTSVLSMLIKTGVPFTDALRIVADTMQNHVWVTSLRVVQQEVERGIPLSAAMSRHSIFPVALIQMITVGEQTGKLDTVLDNMANFYEEQTNGAVKGITTLVEPAVLLVVAIAVAFVVISVIIPIFNLAQQF